MNTSGFHQNVGEGNKSFNAMSPDPLPSEALGKGSGCAGGGGGGGGGVLNCAKFDCTHLNPAHSFHLKCATFNNFVDFIMYAKPCEEISSKSS